MAIVESFGALVEVDAGSGWLVDPVRGAVTLYDSRSYDYPRLYRTQTNIRTCVDFLARNIAQLGLHVFERVSDTDRVRLKDHPLAELLGRPLPARFKVTPYRLIESMMGDLGVFYNAFWLKVRPSGAEGTMGLLRIPPELVSVRGGLVPIAYEVDLSNRIEMIDAEEIVHFRGYNAESAVVGLSPLDTLRRILAEEEAAGDYRENYWNNAARQGGIISRPRDAPKWSDPARDRFRAEFEELHTGGAGSGRTAVLEEGMTWEANTFNPRESEYMAGRKLTREECARAFHIPLPMVGILEYATFSNIKEQHKQLYQDSLGPWLKMIEDDIELQLLPELEPEGRDIYVEFNIAEKMAGSFEDQTKALQSAVGRPWMTPDEARARLNMPSMGGDAAELATPLNVLIGGQASPRDVDVTDEEGGGEAGFRSSVMIRSAGGSPDRIVDIIRGIVGGSKARSGGVDATLARVRSRHEEKWAEVLARTFRRQLDALIGRIPGKVAAEDVWDAARWDRELAADLYRLNEATAVVWGDYVAGTLEGEFERATMGAWLREHSALQAKYVNDFTREAIAEALVEEEPRSAVRKVFDFAMTVRSVQIAVSGVTTAASFGSQEAARQGGLKTKTWQVNSDNPRPEHAAMDGETVGIRDRFSNGMLWPGDPTGGADNNANCACSVRFGR